MPPTANRLSLPANSKAAGAALAWQSWQPASPAKAVILLVHGYAEHFGRYDHVIAQMGVAGFAVYALDLWGHGQSDGTRGFVPAFSVYTDGVETLLAQIQATEGGKPVFILGHSMGGLVATAHLLTHQSAYAGAILSGPALMTAEPPSMLMLWVSRLLSWIAPRMGVLALDANGVSRDADIVAAYRADPLVYTGKMSARLAAEMFDAMARVRAAAGGIKLPLAIFHGDQDSLAAPEGSRYLHDHASSTDKGLTLYPGLYHEIFNEPEQAAVLADVSAWINARINP